MTKKIMLKLPTSHKNPIHKLLPMWIPLFGLNKDLNDVINRLLNQIFFACFLPFHHNGYTNGSVIGSHITIKAPYQWE